ncbi:MAG TPA: hypothetical protein VFZ08_07535 [Terriglobia bacterium]|nr:hypothetical protein [Terriglobia bacterium]
MKLIDRSPFFVRAALAALLLFSAAGLAKTPLYSGKLSLPFTVRWGGAVLPPGEYTFTLLSSAAPYFLEIHGKNASAFIEASSSVKDTHSSGSLLNVVNAGQEHFVQSFEAKDLGITLLYSIPKTPRRQKSPKSKATPSDVRDLGRGKG